IHYSDLHRHLLDLPNLDASSPVAFQRAPVRLIGGGALDEDPGAYTARAGGEDVLRVPRGRSIRGAGEFAVFGARLGKHSAKLHRALRGIVDDAKKIERASAVLTLRIGAHQFADHAVGGGALLG